MYHRIVKWKLRRAFGDINAGRYERIVPQFAPQHRHIFHGEHALGGTRCGVEATRAWYGRLARVFPDLHFEIRDIVVAGSPWRTVAMVEWVDRFAVNGVTGGNQGVHVFRLRWGRVVELSVYCDTDKLRRYLDAKAADGMVEATAAPITDRAPLAPSSPRR
jgi:ketosteroid isomerase-like protein